MTEGWYYNFSEENWSRCFGPFEHRCQAVTAGRWAAVEGDRQSYWTGWLCPYQPQTAEFADLIIEDLGQRAHDAAGERSEEWLVPLSEEARDDLDQAIEGAIDAWLTRHGLAPGFWVVDDAVEHVLPVQGPDGVAPDRGIGGES